MTRLVVAVCIVIWIACVAYGIFESSQMTPAQREAATWPK